MLSAGSDHQFICCCQALFSNILFCRKHTRSIRFKPPSHHEIGDSDSRDDFTGVESTLLISKNIYPMIINIILYILMALAIIGFLNSVRIE